MIQSRYKDLLVFICVLAVLMIPIEPTTLKWPPKKPYTRYDIKCLAKNLYHEARGEPLEGQIAVGYTVINRVKTKGWPISVCNVVYQSYQFSWTHQKPKEPKDLRYFENLAEYILAGIPKDYSRGALFYHSIKVKPHWAKHLHKTVRIGNHQFYRK